MWLYVDGLLMTRSNEKFVSYLKEDMKKEFEMTDIGISTYFLEIEFMRTSKGIIIH